MEAVKIWYSIHNCGDGSAALSWFLTEQAAEEDQDRQNQNEGWAEDCYGSIETFIGSETYKYALKHEEDMRAEWADEQKTVKCPMCGDRYPEDDIDESTGLCLECYEYEAERKGEG